MRLTVPMRGRSIFMLRRNGRAGTESLQGQIEPPRPVPEDIPPRRVTLRLLTSRRGSADRLGGIFNSLQALREHRDHPLTIVRWPNPDVFGANPRKHILGKAPAA